MAKRESKTVVKGVSNDQFNAAMADYAKADARLGIITAKMDNEINKIRDKYQAEVNTLTEEKEKAFEVAQTYSVENQQTMFGKKRSIETVFGVVGFRTGTPKLKLLKGYNWTKVLDNLKAYLPEYVRTTEEPAKDRLLVDREQPEVLAGMTKVGLMVDQDEKFFIELKKEELTEA